MYNRTDLPVCNAFNKAILFQCFSTIIYEFATTWVLPIILEKNVKYVKSTKEKQNSYLCNLVSIIGNLFGWIAPMPLLFDIYKSWGSPLQYPPYHQKWSCEKLWHFLVFGGFYSGFVVWELMKFRNPNMTVQFGKQLHHAGVIIISSLIALNSEWLPLEMPVIHMAHDLICMVLCGIPIVAQSFDLLSKKLIWRLSLLFRGLVSPLLHILLVVITMAFYITHFGSMTTTYKIFFWVLNVIFLPFNFYIIYLDWVWIVKNKPKVKGKKREEVVYEKE